MCYCHAVSGAHTSPSLILRVFVISEVVTGVDRKINVSENSGDASSSQRLFRQTISFVLPDLSEKA